MEFNVLVVEDRENTRQVMTHYLRKLNEVSVIYEASNASEMYTQLEQHKDINVLILDIDLGEESENGLQAYSIARDEGYDIPAILVTGSQFDASLSYTLGVVDVIGKSLIFNWKRLKSSFEKLSVYFKYKKFIESKGVCVPVCGKKNLILFPNDISHIESMSGTVFLHDINGQVYDSILRLNFYEDMLSNSGFMLVHRSYLVNLNKVTSYSSTEIYIGDIVIPLSKEKHVLRQIFANDVKKKLRIV